MNPEALRGFMRMGLFVALSSFVLLFLLDRSSPEFIISLFSLCIGATLVALVAWAARGR
jgi:hypothetical protein